LIGNTKATNDNIKPIEVNVLTTQKSLSHYRKEPWGKQSEKAGAKNNKIYSCPIWTCQTISGTINCMAYSSDPI